MTPAKRQWDDAADAIYNASQSFYKQSLASVVAFKVFIGRKLAGAEYGDGAVAYIAEKTGLSAALLHDAQKMYRLEGLSPKKEKKFIKAFPAEYASWSEYKYQKLYPKMLERNSTAVENPHAHEWVCKTCGQHK